MTQHPTATDAITGSEVQDILVAGKQDGVAMQVVSDGDAMGPSLLGRLVAAVPGYALVIVGSSSDEGRGRISRGTRVRLSCTIGDMPYQFDATILDARRTVVAGASAWAIRTSFPSSLQPCQRRVSPRAPLAEEDCRVFVSDYIAAGSFVAGEAINLSATGLLADFQAGDDPSQRLLDVGRSARVVFAIPSNGDAAADYVSALEQMIAQPDPDRQPRARTEGDGTVLLDLPARVVRLQPGRSGREAAALQFAGVPDEAVGSLQAFIESRLNVAV